MKKQVFIALFAIAILGVSCQQTAKKISIITPMDSLSYAIGNDIGANFERSKLDSINADIIALAIKNYFAKDSSVMKGDDIKRVMKAFSTKRQADMQKERAEQQAKQDAENKIKFKGNIEEGEKFLAENKTKAGIQTTESGLQYKVVKQGTGAMPTDVDKVKVHYTGTLLDGTKFDSSYDRKEPATFGVRQVIPGWTEALKLMKVGSKYKLFIPYQLAYGARGAGKDIPPFSTLIFDIELLSIEK